MKIIWIWNGNRDQFSQIEQKNDGDSFQEHDESMSRFRLAHPKIETVKSEDVKSVDWLAIVPITEVKLARNSQN